MHPRGWCNIFLPGLTLTTNWASQSDAITRLTQKLQLPWQQNKEKKTKTTFSFSRILFPLCSQRDHRNSAVKKVPGEKETARKARKMDLHQSNKLVSPSSSSLSWTVQSKKERKGRFTVYFSTVTLFFSLTMERKRERERERERERSVLSPLVFPSSLGHWKNALSSSCRYEGMRSLLHLFWRTHFLYFFPWACLSWGEREDNCMRTVRSTS